LCAQENERVFKPRRWIASKPGYQVVVLVSRSMIGLILVLAITIDTTTPIGSAIIAL